MWKLTPRSHACLANIWVPSTFLALHRREQPGMALLACLKEWRSCLKLHRIRSSAQERSAVLLNCWGRRYGTKSIWPPLPLDDQDQFDTLPVHQVSSLAGLVQQYGEISKELIRVAATKQILPYEHTSLWSCASAAISTICIIESGLELVTSTPM